MSKTISNTIQKELQHIHWYMLFMMLMVSSIVAGDTKSSPLDRLLDKRAVSVAYFGEFITHPGISVEFPTLLKAARKHTLYRKLGVTLYTHRRNHNAFILTGEAGSRLTNKQGRFGEALVGLGYMHTWLQGDVYTRAGSGTVTESFDWGRPHLVLSFSLGAGWEAHREALPGTNFIRLIAFGEYPFNGLILPHLGLQFGTTFLYRGGHHD